MPDYWTDSFDLEDFELMTGPAKIQNPPQMGRGDRVIFHAVIHVALFAVGEILGNPSFSHESQWAPRWPWLYPCRVDAWLSRITDGPRSTAVAPKAAMGRIQRGGEYARLTVVEYNECLRHLLACPSVKKRPGYDGS
jgi:hypothetical protein